MAKTDPKPNNVRTCPRYKGNGYFVVKESIDHPLDKVVQCPMCNSTREAEIDDPSDDIIITSGGMQQLH